MPTFPTFPSSFQLCLHFSFPCPFTAMVCIYDVTTLLLHRRSRATTQQENANITQPPSGFPCHSAAKLCPVMHIDRYGTNMNLQNRERENGKMGAQVRAHQTWLSVRVGCVPRLTM